MIRLHKNAWDATGTSDVTIYDESGETRLACFRLTDPAAKRLAEVIEDARKYRVEGLIRAAGNDAVAQNRPVTSEALAGALDAFWNAAIGAVNQESYQSPTTMPVIGAMAEGFAAVARELRKGGA